MKTGVLLALCGASLIWSGRTGKGIADALLIWSGIAFLIAGAAYLLSSPRFFAKRSDGRMSPAPYLLCWPFHLINYVLLVASRTFSREEAFHEIVPGLFLGSRLLPGNQSKVLSQRIAGVLDLTCEFSEVGFLRKTHYRCIPLLDRTAPTADQLKEGVRFVQEQLRSGPVYVHCALGHGRSATFVVAYLLAAGIEPNLERAIELVQNRRPKVKLHSEQRRVLEMFNP